MPIPKKVKMQNLNKYMQEHEKYVKSHFNEIRKKSKLGGKFNIKEIGNITKLITKLENNIKNKQNILKNISLKSDKTKNEITSLKDKKKHVILKIKSVEYNLKNKNKKSNIDINKIDKNTKINNNNLTQTKKELIKINKKIELLKSSKQKYKNKYFIKKEKLNEIKKKIDRYFLNIKKNKKNKFDLDVFTKMYKKLMLDKKEYTKYMEQQKNAFKSIIKKIDIENENKKTLQINRKKFLENSEKISIKLKEYYKQTTNKTKIEELSKNKEKLNKINKQINELKNNQKTQNSDYAILLEQTRKIARIDKKLFDYKK
jgi:chromosome segregation protein